ncbi:PD-(D/E)XK motif protein [Intrasporangium calvum]|uniref:PD-(D/E)XK motif protein n=1 Tax=Intrasporangium calvum TaxID=53358 RepID=A0ABT5GEI6_9MICO|nr:PD-(D/E)XK motif protein [Intrasporangium calvum]MDC5696315.1 PD-(D/E)XK motif protein [Intrasporangium calvum]
MNDYQTVWAEIEGDPLADGSLVRRVLPHLEHDAFVGQHRPSRERFVELRLTGATIGSMPKRVPKMRGLDVKVVLETPRRAVIQLRETTPMRTGQFEDLVSDILALLDDSPGDGAASRIIERVIAWQDFFARRDSPLSAEAAAGLFAELTLLNETMIPALGPSRAVDHWTGPDPGLQDFQFADGAIEVKSYRGTGSGQLHISSERQLDTTGADNLFLAYLELDERQDGTGATLSDIVNASHDLVKLSPYAASQLGDKLLSAGWRGSHADVRTERYALRSVEIFQVLNDFPRLVPTMLPAGIGNVHYRIDRSALEPFLVTIDHMTRVLGFTNE